MPGKLGHWYGWK